MRPKQAPRELGGMARNLALEPRRILGVTLARHRSRRGDHNAVCSHAVWDSDARDLDGIAALPPIYIVIVRPRERMTMADMWRSCCGVRVVAFVLWRSYCAVRVAWEF